MMWAACFAERREVALAAPRGHAKSTSITFGYALFMLLFRKRNHLLLLGANETLAGGFLGDIKTELTENQSIRDAFGIERFLKETETELIVLFRDGHRFRILCKGSGQRMRGLKWERKRPDMVLFDDMEDEDQVFNEERRAKFRRWFQGTVRPILSTNGIIRGVGTIIGFDSFLERCMPPQKSKFTVNEPLVSFSTSLTGWFAFKFRAHSPQFKEILWEESFPRERLQEIRAQFASEGALDIYGQEYLNDPIDDTVSYYRKSDFLTMKEVHFDTRKTYYAAVDLAIGEKKRNAYSVIVVGGLDGEGFLNIVDVRRGRWDALQIVDEFFSVYDRWNVEVFRLESENIAKAIGPFLFKKMDEDQKYLVIDDKNPTKDKDRRGISMQGRMRAGKVRFDKEAEWYPDFHEELIRYPKSAFLDQFDAFAWLGLMLEEMVDPQSDQDIEDDEYDEMFQTDSDDGRDAMTGY